LDLAGAAALLYRGVMPAQVVVVKRSRHRAFAILRSIPAWLSGVLLTLRANARAEPTFDLASFEAFKPTDDSRDSAVARDARLLAPERRSGVETPALVAGSDVGECTRCQKCVEVCPSAALELGTRTTAHLAPESGSDSTSMMSFDLDPGCCIGCGECVRICPSEILEMGMTENRVGVGAKPALRSLIADRRQ
jgi:ferredoxin